MAAHTAHRLRPAAAALALLAAANAGAVAFLWLRAGGITDVHDGSTLLTSAGRLAGLLGAYSALVQVLLLGRIPALDRLIGFDRLTAWHRRNGQACLLLLLAHAALIVAGYTLGDAISLVAELKRLITGYPGVITATAALALLVAVVVSSAAAARRRLRYETWWFVHLYAYLAIALAFSHQIATGTAFVGDAAARAYWIALYAVVLGALVLFHKELVMVAFDSEMAEAVGLPVWLINLGLLLLIALTIVVSLRAVGNILVVAMLVTPAAAARLWTDRLVVMMAVSAFFGALGGVVGLLVSYHTDWAAGGTIVLVVTAWFGVSLVAAPRHGLLGRVRGVRAPAPAPGLAEQ
jgi:ABC-type Mn2+/Zn2+ transport system permease subunit